MNKHLLSLVALIVIPHTAFGACKPNPRPIDDIEISRSRLDKLIQKARKFKGFEAKEWEISGFGYEVDIDNDGTKEIYMGYVGEKDRRVKSFILREKNGGLKVESQFPRIKDSENVPEEFVSSCGKNFVLSEGRYFLIEKGKVKPACDTGWREYYNRRIKALESRSETEAAEKMRQSITALCDSQT